MDYPLGDIFNPSSIAVIGASKDEYKMGTTYLSSLTRHDFKGRVYPINPRQTEIMGLKSYPSVLAVPGEIALAIVTIPARAVPQAVAECCQKGVKFVIVHSAGFAELGDEGKKLQTLMLAPLKGSRTRLMGPNCMGLHVPRVGINTVVPHATIPLESGPVSFIGQSGWASENFILMGLERGLRFSKVINIGNQSDLVIEDFLEYLAEDNESRVIGFYIEGLKQGRRFLKLAKQAARKKPLVVWKAGRTEGGIRAAVSHTGSLAGNNVIFETALRQAGATIARNMDELMDLVVGFTSPVLPVGKRVGLLVGSGGGGVTGTDTAEELGLEVPILSSSTQEELVNQLRGILPPFSRPCNPVDLVWPPAGNSAELFMRCARTMLTEVDSLILVSYNVYDDDFARAVIALRTETGKPILIVPAHPTQRRPGSVFLTKQGIPTFDMPDRAIRTLAVMIHYASHRQTTTITATIAQGQKP